MYSSVSMLLTDTCVYPGLVGVNVAFVFRRALRGLVALVAIVLKARQSGCIPGVDWRTRHACCWRREKGWRRTDQFPYGLKTCCLIIALYSTHLFQHFYAAYLNCLKFLVTGFVSTVFSSASIYEIVSNTYKQQRDLCSWQLETRRAVTLLPNGVNLKREAVSLLTGGSKPF